MILNIAPVRHLFIFIFLCRRKSRQVETCFAPYPFTCYMWRFAHPPSARSFCCLLCPLNCEPYGISPRFRQSGDSGRSSLFARLFRKFVLLVAASCRILHFVYSSLLLESEAIVYYCLNYCICFNTIQRGDCHRVVKEIV